MPGFYADGEYDVAGFIVGVVDRVENHRRKIDPAWRRADWSAVRRPAHQRILAGAQAVLRNRRAARRIRASTGWKDTVGEELLKPHVNYEPVLREALAEGSRSKVWPTSPAAASRKIWIAFFRRTARRKFSWDRGRCCRCAG